MKKFSLQLLMALTAVFIAASCTNTKNKESADRHYQANGDEVYPAIEGMVPYAVKVDEKGDDEANLKIQVLVGKMMDVDCNHHWLEGNFEEETLEGYGYEYYIFETDGNVASTMMTCPDEEKTSKFIHGEDQFIPYNSKIATPVYAPEGYEVRYAIWNVDNEFNVTQKPDESINAEAAKQLKSFPDTMENYDRYVIYLSEKADEESLRLEVIPGVTKEVDCNTYWLIGDSETKEVEGMGYEYMVFESNGDIVSTRMACPDDELTEKFIAANGHFGRYNSKLPVVVFVQKGIELKYKIWKANDMKVADKL